MSGFHHVGGNITDVGWRGIPVVKLMLREEEEVLEYDEWDPSLKYTIYFLICSC